MVGFAMLLDDGKLWVGLVRHPEGADIGGGLLWYDTKSSAAQMYKIADVIHTIDRLGDALYCGTSHGFYILRDGQITQLRFEPDGNGKTVIVPRAVL
jgi:hypothetical protein